MTSLTFGTIGDNTIDQYFGAENTSFVGGNAVNVAVKLAALGASVRYAGAVAPDANGLRVRSALETNRVDVGELLELPGVTSISQIEVQSNGERNIGFEDFAVCADYRPDAGTIDRLADCAFVHIGWTPFAAEIRSELRRRGVRVSQDCAVSEGFDNLDVAFGSVGADRKAARSLALEAVSGGASLAVITLGADGSIAFDGTSWWSADAEPTAVVDTTGAGDAYIAGFLHSFATDPDVGNAMISGSRVAAGTCRHLGGFEQVPMPLPAGVEIRSLS